MQADATFDDPFLIERMRRRERKPLDRSLAMPHAWPNFLRTLNLAIPVSLICAGLLVILSLPLAAPARPMTGGSLNMAAKKIAGRIDALTPQAVRPLTAQEAVTANALIPLSSSLLHPGMSLHVPGNDKTFGQALTCLTAAVYYEAASEPIDGQRAVAQVVINRVRHPAFPRTICGVVFQGAERRTGCQFSFTCDGSLRRRPLPQSWLTAEAIAREALAGSVYNPVGLSTHYHANYVVPYWASSLLKSAVVGRHIFYRWSGKWGGSGAFVQRYADPEPFVDMLENGQNSPEDGAIPLDPSPGARTVLSLTGGSLRTAYAGDAIASPMGTNEPNESPRSESSRFVIPMKRQPDIQITMVPH